MSTDIKDKVEAKIVSTETKRRRVFLHEMINGTINSEELERVTREYYKDKPFIESDNQIDKRYSVTTDGEYTYYPVHLRSNNGLVVSSNRIQSVIPLYYNPDFDRNQLQKELDDAQFLSFDDVAEKIRSLDADALREALINTIKNRSDAQEDVDFLGEVMALAEGKPFESIRRKLVKMRRKAIEENARSITDGNGLHKQYGYFKTMLKTPEEDKMFTIKQALFPLDVPEDKYTIEQTEDGYILKKVK